MLFWWKKIFFVLVLALGLRACVLETIRNPDDAMSPALQAGDIALVWKLSYGIRIPGSGAIIWNWASVKRGDIVVVSGVGDPPVNLVRRVEACPGDKILLPGQSKMTVLEPGEYFLLADKKDSGLDGRQLGTMSRRSIVGKVTHIWLPANSKVKSNNATILQRVL